MDEALLRDVSRSFFLTLRLMPRAVRGPLALGYLLARASDSIADANTLDPALRVEALTALREGAPPAHLEALVSAQSHPREAELVRRLPGLIETLARSPDAAALAETWGHILRGQIFDLTRFGPGAAPLSAAELEEYTYLVAGCVGEFWTRLCAGRLPGFSLRPTAELVALGVSYGRGLQLVNILRDRRGDAAIGRVYAPDERFDEIKARAARGLDHGLEWCRAVAVGRVRYACVIPAQLGQATLARITRESGPVKVSRAEVRRTLLRALPWIISPRSRRATG